MSKGVSTIANGLAALSLSLMVWSITSNVVGWAILAAPGAVLILWGWYLVYKGK